MSDGAQEPLTLVEVKAQLRVRSADEDSTITDMIPAARQVVEDYTGLVMTRRTVVEYLRRLDGMTELRTWPFATPIGIAVTYLDMAGADQVADPATWRVLPAYRPARLLPLTPWWDIAASVDRRAPISVTIEAGYLPADVPPALKRAMLLMIQFWYDNEGVSDEICAPAVMLMKTARLVAMP